MCVFLSMFMWSGARLPLMHYYSTIAYKRISVARAADAFNLRDYDMLMFAQINKRTLRLFSVPVRDSQSHTGNREAQPKHTHSTNVYDICSRKHTTDLLFYTHSFGVAGAWNARVRTVKRC